MSAKTIHTCLSVRGALKWPDAKLRGLVGDENGDLLEPESVRNWLRDQIAQGREVLPFGKACRGFDYRTGCPGHTIRRGVQ